MHHKSSLIVRGAFLEGVISVLVLALSHWQQMSRHPRCLPEEVRHFLGSHSGSPPSIFAPSIHTHLSFPLLACTAKVDLVLAEARVNAHTHSDSSKAFCRS